MLPDDDDDDKWYAIETCRSRKSVLKKWFKINDKQLVHLLVVWYLVNLQDARCNNKDNKIIGLCFYLTNSTQNFTFEKKSVRRFLLWLQRVIAIVTVYTKYVLLFINQFVSVLIWNNIVYGQKNATAKCPTIKPSFRCPSILLAHRRVSL